MRLVTTIPHHTFSISIFDWNNKFFLKIEYGQTEQIYKFNKENLENGLDSLKKLITPSFLEQNMLRFRDMHHNIKEGISKI